MPLVLLLYHTQEHVKISVTKFGEISPLWQNSASLWAIFKGLNSIGQFLNLFWQITFAFGQVSIGINGSVLKTIKPFGHTVSSRKIDICFKGVWYRRGSWGTP